MFKGNQRISNLNNNNIELANIMKFGNSRSKLGVKKWAFPLIH